MEKQKSHKIWLSCEKATELMDKKSILKLSLKEEIQLKFHKSICSACKQYHKQSVLIDDVFSSYFQNTNFGTTQPLKNEQLKIKIIDALKDSE